MLGVTHYRFYLCLKVEGHFILTNREDHTLVSVSEQLFPLHQGSSATSRTELQGHYSWSFIVQLPRTVELKHDKQDRQYKLPATFVERFAGRVSVIYRIFATVTRGILSTEHVYVAVFLCDYYGLNRYHFLQSRNECDIHSSHTSRTPFYRQTDSLP